GYPFQSAVHFIVSTDGGATWGTNHVLKTEANSVNSPSSVLSSSPTVLVDPSGTVYVAYASNFTYQLVCTNTTCYNENTANVVVATSTNNGTSFSYADAAQGVLSPYSGFYPNAYVDPQPALAYNPVLGQVYMTYTAGLFADWCHYYGYATYCNPEVLGTIWFQNSSDSGATWSTPARVQPQLADPNGAALYSPSYNPSMAVDVNGRIHLQFTYMDDSQCFSVGSTYYNYYCAPIEELYQNSSDGGLTWTDPVVVDSNLTPGNGPYRESWDGTFSATLTAGTQVLLGWTHVQCPTWSTPPYGGSCYQPQYNTATNVHALVETSRLFEGVGLVVSFTETGLPAGTIWNVNIGGNLRFGPAGDTFSISGVPPGAQITWSSTWINTSYGVAYYPTFSVSPPSSFSGPATVVVTYTELILMNVLSIPSLNSYTFTGAQFNFNMNPLPGAYWITKGTPQTLTVTAQSLSPFCYGCLNGSWSSWSGIGTGSVSSTSMSISLTPTGPVNETANFAINGICWVGYYGGCLNYSYDLSFQQVGLPAGVQWGVTIFNPDGSSITNLSTNSLVGFNVTSGLTSFDPWTVPDPATGEFWVPTTTVSSPVMVPQASSIVVSYTLRSASTASYSSTFQETGLWAGNPWSLELGGTGYGMTSVNGSWSLTGGSTLSVNGSYVYLNNGSAFYASSIDVMPFVINSTSYSVAPGALVTLNGSAIVTILYKPMYRLTVTASVGGTVTPDAQWVKLGGSVVLGETAWPGYYFIGWTGTGTGSVTTGSTSPTVAPRTPVTEFATFRPIPSPTWNVTVSSFGLPVGTPFSVSIGGTTYSGLAGFKVGNLSTGGYVIDAPTIYLNSTDTTRFILADLSSTRGRAGGVLNITADGSMTVAYGAQ
ncbi:MAG TPA: sialidase family protein, partial [Thermoplasmata archaeon]